MHRTTTLTLAVVIAASFVIGASLFSARLDQAVTAQTENGQRPEAGAQRQPPKKVPADQIRLKVEEENEQQPPRQPSPSLFRSFKELFGAVPVFQRDGALFGETIEQADTLFAESKQSNAEAIRQANRQVRVFNSSHSCNVILIAVENLAPGDLSVYGQTRYQTPAIDALAKAGVRFSDYYASSTVDEVAWWSLWSGFGTAGPPAGWDLDSKQFVLPEMMWQANYNTALLGRLMVGGLDGEGGSLNNGFEHALGFHELDSPWELYPEFLFYNGERFEIPANAGDENDWLTHEILGREAILYMDKHCKGRPFFLTLSLEVGARGIDPHSEKIADEIDGADTWTPLQQSHATSIKRLDELVKMLLEYLKTPDAPHDTIIVLTGVDGVLPDPQGLDLNEFFNRTGSFTLDPNRLGEGNLRVPLIVYGCHKTEQGLVSEHVAGTWDLLPTLGELVRAFKQPEHIDGDSFAAALRGEPVPPRGKKPGFEKPGHYVRPLVWRTADGARAVRVAQWKAVQDNPNGPWELYDVEADPDESENVAAEHQELIQRIEAALERAAAP